MERKLKPWLAVLLSLPVSGLGFVYARKFTIALIFFIASFIVANAFLAIFIYGNLGLFKLIIPLFLLFGFIIFEILFTYFKVRKIGSVAINGKMAISNKWYFYVIVLIIVTVLRPYLIPDLYRFKSYVIPSAGMINTLFPGEYLIADMEAFIDKPPERNDLVIFLWPGDGETLYIKRCVAVGGQKIELVDKALYVDDIAIVENENVVFTDPQRVISRPGPHEGSRDNWGPYIVPEGCFFMLGDNRDNSSDSRYWGPVKAELILGKPIFIYFSSDFDRIGYSLE